MRPDQIVRGSVRNLVRWSTARSNRPATSTCVFVRRSCSGGTGARCRLLKSLHSATTGLLLLVTAGCLVWPAIVENESGYWAGAACLVGLSSLGFAKGARLCGEHIVVRSIFLSDDRFRISEIALVEVGMLREGRGRPRGVHELFTTASGSTDSTDAHDASDRPLLDSGTPPDITRTAPVRFVIMRSRVRSSHPAPRDGFRRTVSLASCQPEEHDKRPRHSDHVVIAQSADALAQLRFRDRGDLVDHQPARLAHPGDVVRIDEQSDQRGIGRIGRECADGHRGSGIESIVLNDDNRSGFADVSAPSSSGPDLAPPHSSARASRKA